MYYNEDWQIEIILYKIYMEKNEEIFWTAVDMAADYYKENYLDDNILYNEVYTWFLYATEDILVYMNDYYNIKDIKDFCNFTKGYYYGKIRAL